MTITRPTTPPPPSTTNPLPTRNTRVPPLTRHLLRARPVPPALRSPAGTLLALPLPRAALKVRTQAPDFPLHAAVPGLDGATAAGHAAAVLLLRLA